MQRVSLTGYPFFNSTCTKRFCTGAIFFRTGAISFCPGGNMERATGFISRKSHCGGHVGHVILRFPKLYILIGVFS